ncbi:hypothetical protein Pint_16805 [Pistacia integerrima]|uniref:Uncharacterized protein n=1 Tax=Pistacia integerrima TaxID=434235 RepID=A0ACC0ZD22_9ROSI|nr:hypothetical protein Pint_16805 [Pistacia integerrima]
MASNFTLLVFILSCFCSAGATTIYIGGSKGWSPDSDISTIQARVGDVLGQFSVAPKTMTWKKYTNCFTPPVIQIQRSRIKFITTAAPLSHSSSPVSTGSFFSVENKKEL